MEIDWPDAKKLAGSFLVTVLFLFLNSVVGRAEGIDADPDGDIRIELEADSFSVGEKIKIHVYNELAPIGASVALWLSPVMPADYKERGYTVPGCYGALTPVTLPIVRDEANTFYWSGLFTWWAPYDVPIKCKHFSAGRFQIHAQFYRDNNALVVGRPTKSQNTRLQQSATSRPFDLTGDIDMSRLKEDLNDQAVRFVWELFELPNSGDLLQVALSDSNELNDLGGGYYCLTKEIPLLYSGVVEACTAEPVVTPLGLRLPHGDYISVRGMGELKSNVEEFESISSAASRAVAELSLEEFDLTVDNLDEGSARCHSHDRIFCRVAASYVSDNSELFITSRDWTILPEKELWLFHFETRASRGSETPHEGESFVCVDKNGEVFRIATALQGSSSAARLQASFHNKTFDCVP